MPQPGKHSGNVDKAVGLTKQGGSKNRRDENEAEGTGKADPFRPKNGFRIADHRCWCWQEILRRNRSAIIQIEIIELGLLAHPRDLQTEQSRRNAVFLNQ